MNLVIKEVFPTKRIKKQSQGTISMQLFSKWFKKRFQEEVSCVQLNFLQVEEQGFDLTAAKCKGRHIFFLNKVAFYLIPLHILLWHVRE